MKLVLKLFMFICFILGSSKAFCVETEFEHLDDGDITIYTGGSNMSEAGFLNFNINANIDDSITFRNHNNAKDMCKNLIQKFNTGTRSPFSEKNVSTKS